MLKTSTTFSPHNPHKPPGGRFSTFKFVEAKRVPYSSEYKE
jgi:hypothetical protein